MQSDTIIITEWKRGGNITIYVDILFIVNLYVDYFILLSVKQYFQLRVKTVRLLFGALLGASFSLLSLLSFLEIVNYILALLFGVIITLATFYPMNKKMLLKCYCGFLSLSFGFSGMVLLLSQITSNAVVIGGKPYFQISPLLLFLFTILSYLCSGLLAKFHGKWENRLDYCKIIIEGADQQVELFAKIDTGNSLKEPFSGTPVIVAEKEELSKITDDKDMYRLIPYNSLGGSGLLPAFKPKNIYIKKSGKTLECYVAIYDGKLSTGSYNCIICPELI